MRPPTKLDRFQDLESNLRKTFAILNFELQISFLNKGSQGLDIARSILIRSNKIGIVTFFVSYSFKVFFEEAKDGK